MRDEGLAMFDASLDQSSPVHSRRTGASASLIAHVGLALLVYAALTGAPQSGSRERAATVPTNSLIWIPTSAAGGGGGGGGDRQPDAGSTRVVGRSRALVPPALQAPERSTLTATEPPPQTMAIAAIPMGAANDTFVGLMTPASEVAASGSGADRGAGPLSGSGASDGKGPGIDPGERGGTGGDIYGVGNGVSTPELIRDVKPNYTADAVRAKIQGVVVLECVVLPDGRVGDVKILRSLDAQFGLDVEAVQAARQWRFVPGRRLGQPVAVRVVIELGFRLR